MSRGGDGGGSADTRLPSAQGSGAWWGPLPAASADDVATTPIVAAASAEASAVPTAPVAATPMPPAPPPQSAPPAPASNAHGTLAYFASLRHPSSARSVNLAVLEAARRGDAATLELILFGGGGESGGGSGGASSSSGSDAAGSGDEAFCTGGGGPLGAASDAPAAGADDAYVPPVVPGAAPAETELTAYPVVGHPHGDGAVTDEDATTAGAHEPSADSAATPATAHQMPEWARVGIEWRKLSPAARKRAANAKDWLGDTALHLAAQARSVASVDMLLRAGANAGAAYTEGGGVASSPSGGQSDGRAAGGTTALHVCARRDAPACAARLIAAGADPSAIGRRGSTPLHWAAHHDSAHTARVLIASGVDVNTQNGRGSTALHLAAHWGNMGVLREIVATRAARYDTVDFEGCTALDVAVRREQVVMASSALRPTLRSAVELLQVAELAVPLLWCLAVNSVSELTLGQLAATAPEGATAAGAAAAVKEGVVGSAPDAGAVPSEPPRLQRAATDGSVYQRCRSIVTAGVGTAHSEGTTRAALVMLLPRPAFATVCSLLSLGLFPLPVEPPQAIATATRSGPAIALDEAMPELVLPETGAGVASAFTEGSAPRLQLRTEAGTRGAT